MDPEKIAHWQAADALFDQWLDLADGERDAWLAAQDPIEPVRRRLQMLIDAHRRPRAGLAPAHDDLSGMALGDWTLEEELGRGGMAVVYRAWREQGMARQQAAVKILTLGALGAAGRERFQREAEILARLNHPNVTALVDSGVSPDGTCWLAMPLVEGRRIDAWCDGKALDAHAIVRLYLQVCGAIAYAHRNLVIHRDIKPSNVLVDDHGHVRLLDFGIGQFADGQAEATLTMWRALTPGYAAPEQLRGDPPSTAVDVYGLGALLHRLLTGRTPHLPTDDADTTRPSLLVRDAGDAYHRHYVPLKTDLDRVLLKALSEEPEHRYPTAEALADDLRRWLDGRPVLAEKPKLGYRLHKFVSRNRAGVAAGILLALTLAGGVAATLWQAGEARRHAQVAERNAALAEKQAGLARQEAKNARQRAHRAEAVRDYLGSMMITVRGEDGGIGRVPDVIDAAAEGARGNYPTGRAVEPLTAADILLLTGTVRYNLGDHERSFADFQEALAMLEPHRSQAAGELSRTHWELARHAKRRGQPDEMLAHARQAVELNKLWDAPPSERVRAMLSLGEALLYRNREEAAQVFTALLEDIQADEALKDTIPHINALNGLSIALSGPDHDPRVRLPIQEERLRIADLIYPPDSGGLAHTLSDVTHTYRAVGMLDRAEELARRSVEVADRSLQNPLMIQGTTRCNLGLVLQQQGRLAEAMEVFQAGTDRLVQARDSHVSSERCSTGLAYAAGATGRYGLALQALDRSVEVLTLNGRATHPDAVTACGLRASLALRNGRSGDAATILDGCAPEDAASAPAGWRQARAEWLFLSDRTGEASSMLEVLRTEQRPETHQRPWMRPWMLSLLLADTMDDAAMRESLVAELGDFVAQPPLSDCLATPNATNCLVLP